MWWTWVLDVLGADRYTQHSICLTNDPIMLFLYVLGDMTTSLSYFVIGGTLLAWPFIPAMVTVRMKFLYGAFILLCGLSHATSVMVLFAGVYRLDVVVTAMMAAVSALTAFIVVYEHAKAS